MARGKKRAAKKRAAKKAVMRPSSKARDAKIGRFRSLVLDKIRSDIALKRAAVSVVQKVKIPDLGSKGYWKAAYWKMPYWKMKYWKAGAEMIGIDQVIDPATSLIAEAPRAAGRKRVR